MRMSVNIRGWSSLSAQLTRIMNPAFQAGVMNRAAQRSRNDLVRLTPKKWTGQTRRGWKTRVDVGRGTATTFNDNKVMLFLELGTRPYAAPAGKFLFIPLTRRAAQAGARGVYAANAAARASNSANAGRRRGRGRMPYVIGVDFVWAKRRRGISPRRIVANHRATAYRYMMEEMKAAIRASITRS